VLAPLKDSAGADADADINTDKDEDEDEDEDDTYGDSSYGNMLEPSTEYERECEEVVEEINGMTCELLGDLTVTERRCGRDLIKKITGFASAVSQSDQSGLRWKRLVHIMVKSL
jgi:hypothetical protein